MSSSAIDPMSISEVLPMRPPNGPAHLPRMIRVGNVLCPAAPNSFDETGVADSTLTDLTTKLSNTVPRLSSDSASEQLKLPVQLVEKIIWRLKDEQLVEILGSDEFMSYRYSTSQRGIDHARRLLEMSGYIGPAPVTLEQYAAMLEWQVQQVAPVDYDAVKAALAPLVLAPECIDVAALAASSGRSLFLFGPPGNGKTTLGRLLHNSVEGELWIPHCIAIDSHIIRIFDRQVHEPISGYEHDPRIDQRWVRIKRPMIVTGGEMTMQELDLAYSPTLRFYEAPPHVKANGGTFLLDDFGRQQMDPADLLNRWIIPLEQQFDHLTLNTGQKIRVPFRLLLVVATNLKVSDVADPAFLRRMGYRLHIDKPTPQRYVEIFRRYAAGAGAPPVDPALLEKLIERYGQEGRELRSSEPRDLVERVRDICRLRNEPLEVTQRNLDLAWSAYFGDTAARAQVPS